MVVKGDGCGQDTVAVANDPIATSSPDLGHEAVAAELKYQA